jgi:hypothetical protein
MLGRVHALLEPGHAGATGRTRLLDRGAVAGGLGSRLGKRHRGRKPDDGNGPENPDFL